MTRILMLALIAPLSVACNGSDPASPPSPLPPSVVAVASVTLSGAPAELEVGRTATIQATTRDSQGNVLSGRTIVWTSGSDAIATVSTAGAVVGAGSGTASFTATSEGKSASALIRIDTRAGFLTAIVESVRQMYDLPALSGAIVTRGGGMFGSAVSGRRRASAAAPVTINDMWHIGSNLKAITAHVAGIAVAQGAISWSTTLAQAYPELAGTMRAEYRDVTLRQLLGHIGGIIPNVPNPSSVAGSGSLTAQRAAIASWATAMMPTGGGVGQYTYSNVGFMIAANMVERALSSPWETVMEVRLLAPLGITAFGWGPAPAAQNPVGHQRNGSAWIEFPTLDNPPYLSAAGRSHWSLDAWGKVVQEIMRADQGQSALVPQAIARINTTSQSNANYASGWLTSSAAWAMGRGVEHDGSNTLNYARVQVALDRGVSVMGVTNSHETGGSRSTSAIAQLMTRLWAYYDRHGQ